MSAKTPQLKSTIITSFPRQNKKEFKITTKIQRGLFKTSEMREEEVLREDVTKAIDLLKNDVYFEIMKPYFKAGNNYKDFMYKWFGEKVKDKPLVKYEKPFFERYLMITIDSRTYLFYRVMFLVTSMLSYCLVPLECLVLNCRLPDSLHALSVATDVMWLVHILTVFVTQTNRDSTLLSNPWTIAKRYLLSGKLIIDILSMLSLFDSYQTNALLWLRFVRMVYIYNSLDIIHDIIIQFERIFGLSKKTVSKVAYTFNVMVLLLFIMHLVACIWVAIGEQLLLSETGSWLTQKQLRMESLGLVFDAWNKYITAFYWVIVTLTTVGYGDIYGLTWQEYAFTMMVEFIGIAFFSFIMGSINNVLFSDLEINMTEALFERLQIWLVKLDNSRTDKSISKTLFLQIQAFISQAYLYDHTKLIKGFGFLEELKPSLRSRLVHELFPKFFQQFQHMFEFDNAVCGKEFISYFVSQLYCRFFVAAQTIIAKGDMFDELFMIFQGQVTLSLHTKDRFEYFQFFRTNYFGDYQIMQELKSSECYTAGDKESTYCYCINKVEFLALLATFPDAKALFQSKASQRRIEMRRIKFIYMHQNDIFDRESKNEMDFNPDEIELRTYSAKKTKSKPECLRDPNFYFSSNKILKSFNIELLEDISDSEQPEISSKQEVERQLNFTTLQSLQGLIDQVTMMNHAFTEVHDKAGTAFKNARTFIQQISKAKIDTQVQVPQVEPLSACTRGLVNQMVVTNN